MARARAKSVHVGGTQLPLITPPSEWVAPAELPDLRRAGLVAIDLETRDDSLSAGRGPGWCYGAGHVAGVAAAWAGGEFYAPLRHPDGENMDEGGVRRWLADHMACTELQVVYHNAPYDTGWSKAQWGLDPPANLNCSLAAAVVVDENRLAYGLDDLCKWRGLPGKDEQALREAAAAYGYVGDAVKGALWRLPARYVGPYAQADARATLALFNALRPSLEAEGTWEAYRLEADLIPMCLEMRRRGIRVDLEGVAKSRARLLERRDEVLVTLAEHLGRSVCMEDVRSPRWLEKAHDSQRIGYPRTAKTGQGSFTKDWMRGHQHWLPRLVSRADQLTEAADKFLKGFIQDYAHKGRIHASINQYRGESGDGTRSHRFSYSDPALQQAPSRDEELAPIFRGAFLPEEGEVWGAHDVSQQEFRFIVHFAAALNQPRAAEAVQKYIDDPETDFHALVVEWTGLERKRAKDVNFAKAFEAGIPKFAEMIRQPVEEAARIYKLYDEELPFVRGAAKEAQRLAQARGYVKLIDGARSHFDLWEPAWREPGDGYQYPRPLAAARELWPEKRLRRAFTQKAFNRAVQGSAARQTKRFMLDCWRAGYVPLIQMHDDLNFSHKEEAEGLRINEIMRSAIKLRVPMVVDSEYGPNWGAARKIKDKDGKVIYGATWAEAKRLAR